MVHCNGLRFKVLPAYVPAERRQSLSSQLVAHLGQNMRFVLDASVEEFLALHAQCRGKETPPVEY